MFTKNAYDKLNENTDGIVFLRPIEEMTIEEIENELNELRVKVQGLKKFKKTFDEYELSKKQGFIAYENWQECEKVIKTTVEKIKLRIEGNNRILNTKVNNWVSEQLKVQNTTLELVLMLLGEKE